MPVGISGGHVADIPMSNYTPVGRINYGLFMRKDKVSKHLCLGRYHKKKLNKRGMFIQLWQLSLNICKDFTSF